MTNAEKIKLNALIAKGEKIAKAKGENFQEVITTFVNSYIFDNIDFVLDKAEKLEKKTHSFDSRN